MPAVGLIILAAGCSSRLGTPKQLLKFGEKTLLTHAIEAGSNSDCEKTVVVLGSEYNLIKASIEDQEVRIIQNENWQEGIASSIRCGVIGLEESDPSIDAAIIATCDQPLLTADILNSLIKSHTAHRKPIAACEYQDTLGTPVLFERSLFRELKSLTGTEGAKQVVFSDMKRVASLPFPGGAFDIDTKADLDTILSFESMEQPMPKLPPKNQPFTEAIETLQKFGLLTELSMRELIQLLDDMDVELLEADEEMDLVSFLGIYYASEQKGLSKRAIKDGFLHHDWRWHQETDDIAAEICQLIGKPILQQIDGDPSGFQFILTGEAQAPEFNKITIRDDSDDLFGFVNEALARMGDKRRFVSIETDADYFAYYLVDANAYKAIFEAKSPALIRKSLPGVDMNIWFRQLGKSP